MLTHPNSRFFMMIVFMLACWSQTVLAHSDIQRTVPSDGAVLAEAPNTIDLNFKDAIKLTRVTLQHNDKKPVALDLAGAQDSAKSFSLENVVKISGVYKIEWRGLGNDGHVMIGIFTFTVL